MHHAVPKSQKSADGSPIFALSIFSMGLVLHQRPTKVSTAEARQAKFSAREGDLAEPPACLAGGGPGWNMQGQRLRAHDGIPSIDSQKFGARGALSAIALPLSLLYLLTRT
jgi:hypothetical protein